MACCISEKDVARQPRAAVMILVAGRGLFSYSYYQRIDGVSACTLLYIGTGVRSDIVITQAEGSFEKHLT